MRNYSLNRIEKYDDFRAFITGIGSKYGDRTAITEFDDEGTKTEYTYNRLYRDVRCLAEELLSKGLEGKHIIIACAGGYRAFASMIAAACVGVAVPLDTEQSKDTLIQMAEYVDPSCVLASESVCPLLDESETLSKLPMYTIDAGNEWNVLTEHGKQKTSYGIDLFYKRSIDPGDTAMIFYTSGTTSTAKPVMLSHRALLHNGIGSIESVTVPKRVFTSLPLYHTYGFTVSVPNNLIAGCNVCINGNIRYTVRDMKQFDPEMVMAVPLIAELIHRLLVTEAKGTPIKSSKGFPLLGIKPKMRKNDKLVKVREKVFPSLSLIICGGAHLADTICTTLMQFGVLVLQGYGITECSPLISVNRNRYYKVGSVGIPVPGYEVTVSDSDEIMVRGDMLMNGYYKNEEETRKAFRDGYFCTGDLGFVDRRGFIYIKGRIKNLIVLKNGKKISPYELEDYVSRIPAVKEVIAYGTAAGSDTDDVLPAITVYPNPELCAGMTQYEILNMLQKEIDAINSKLPSYKQIRLINICEHELPKTSTNKIKRH